MDAKVQPTASEQIILERFCRDALAALSTFFGPPEGASDLNSKVSLRFGDTETRHLTETDRQMLMAHVSQFIDSYAYLFYQSGLISLSPLDLLRLCEVLHTMVSPLSEVTVEARQLPHSISADAPRMFPQVG
jgi:hypothetical protein